jgi:hypothetical protein
LSGCTAPWQRLVRYSAEPAQSGLGIEAGAYRAVIRSYQDSVRVNVVPLFTYITGAPDLAAHPAPVGDIPGHWADTLKVQLRAAFTDAGYVTLADSGAIIRALATLPAQDFVFAAPRGSHPTIRVSAPGFNQDSTIAVVSVAYFDRGFSQGDILLLARKPGMEWCIWSQLPLWIT